MYFNFSYLIHMTSVELTEEWNQTGHFPSYRNQQHPITSISSKISIWKPARDLERHHYMRHTDPPDKNDFLATIDICVKPVLLTNIQQMCGRTKRGTITYTNIYTHPNYRLPRKVASATAIKANQANLTTTSIIIMIMTSASILLLLLIITIWMVIIITWASRVR